jgi:nucleoid-associated protein YgaU
MTGIIPPVRGWLMRKGSFDKVDFHFNPTNLTIMKRPHWTSRPQRNHEKGAPHQEYIGSSPATLRMKLMFDSVSDFGIPRSVGDAVDKLKSWTSPTRSSINAGNPQPPTLELFWGAEATGYFPPCRIQMIKVMYTRFDITGSPIRATVDLTLAEVADTLGPQNPTSGGIVGRRSVTVDAGDTLPAVAFREYGNPNMWRALAEANGIDDPLRLKPGSTLFVPAKPDAERLVRGTDG